MTNQQNQLSGRFSNYCSSHSPLYQTNSLCMSMNSDLTARVTIKMKISTLRVSLLALQYTHYLCANLSCPRQSAFKEKVIVM
jgi:hypothetical protein